MNDLKNCYKIYDLENKEFREDLAITQTSNVIQFLDGSYKKLDHRNFFIIKCSGRKDINENPLYEGDIILYKDYFYIIRQADFRGWIGESRTLGSYIENLEKTLVVGHIYYDKKIIKLNFSCSAYKELKKYFKLGEC